MRPRRAVKACLAALLLALPALAEPLPPRPPGGVADPTLALNLTAPADFLPGFQFVDLMRLMRPWSAHGPGGRMSHAELRAGGFLDEAGWPRAIPPGHDWVGTLWEWNAMPELAWRTKGRYVLSWEGAGRIDLAGDARVIEARLGRILFENTRGKSLLLRIRETDPAGTGDHLRAMTLVREADVARLAGGAVFDADWLALVADARQLRFMDWAGTNGSAEVSWQDRARPDGPHDGRVPAEHMIALSNLVGADPWFTMPHLADEAYLRRFAELVRDTLRPGLTARMEFSNEVWNWSFPQARWTAEAAEADWGTGGAAEHHARRATRAALIWREVFADEPDRLVTVLASQGANSDLTRRLLEAPAWRRRDPASHRPAGEVFDELAITHYFGGATLREPALRDALLAELDVSAEAAAAYLEAALTDPAYPRSVPALAPVWAEHARLARAHGLRLVAYEGGQHLHHHGRRKDLSERDAAQLDAFMEKFVRSPAMTRLHLASWAAWAAVSDGPFMQFGDVTRPGRWGSWGISEGPGTITARGAALMALSAATPPWWDAPPHAGRYLDTIGAPGP